MFKKSKFGLIICYIFLIVFTSIVFLATVNKDVPLRDSGVFLYIGREIIKGGIPYKDVWDHKPPVIFFINALGLWIASGSLGGVLFLEYIFLIGSVTISFFIINKLFGIVPAILIVLIWLQSFFVLFEGGNLTEEYGLFFQFLIYFVFSKIQLSDSTGKWNNILSLPAIGFLGGMLFFLKQNLIGIEVSISFYIILISILNKTISKGLNNIIKVAGGFLLFCLIIFGYFYLNHGLSFFLDAAFYFNYFYPDKSVGSLAQVIIYGFKFNGILLTLGLLGWIRVYSLIRSQNYKQSILIVSFIALPLEFLLASLSGRTYLHYFISWLPPLTILGSYLISRLKFTKTNLLLPLLLLLIILYTSFFTLKIFKAGIRAVSTYSPSVPAIVDFIKITTSKNDYVLMWGAESAVNFATNRNSPTRFIYQYPLYTKGYVNSKMIDEFYNDIKIKEPKYIIENSMSGDSVKKINCSGDFRKLNSTYKMDSIIQFICENYILKQVIEEKWLVYQRTIN